jgi:hypothetical protein
MRPFTVLIGIVLGTAASITFGLTAVLIVSVVLREHPEFRRELPRLTLSVLAFAGLTAASAGSFLSQLKNLRWRGWAHAGTLVVLGAIVLWYWPRRA